MFLHQPACNMINLGTILGREAEEDLADELGHQFWRRRRRHGAAVCEDLVGIERVLRVFCKNTPDRDSGRVRFG